MAITENFESRTMHITADGTSVSVILDMTWVDFGNGSDDNWTLPWVGDAIDVLNLPGLTGRDDLRLTDIQTVVVDNVNAKIKYLFSTDSIDKRKEREDQIGSWDYEYITDMDIVNDDVYFEVDSGGTVYTKKLWSTQWVDTYGGTAGEDPPEFIRYVPKMSLRMNIYGSTVASAGFQTYLEGRVNSFSLFRWIYDQLNAADRLPSGSERPAADDIENWLCVDAAMKRVRYNCFEYSLLFKFNDIGWNNVRKEDGNLAIRNVYPGYDFRKLFQGLKLDTADEYSRG